MLKYREFVNEFRGYPVNEIYNKDITTLLSTKYDKDLAKHSNDDRVKNLNNMSIEDFANIIAKEFKVIPQINPPGRSGSSKFSSVQFDIEGKTKNIILAGGAVATRGHGFEYDFANDLKTLQANRVFDAADYRYPNIIKDVISKFGIDETTSFNVIPEGSKNSKREVNITDNGIVIGNKNLEIGSTISDITLNVNGKPYYISLKLGNTVQFSNTGLVGLFPKDDIINGEIKNEIGKKLLDMLGVNNEVFCDVYNSYGKKKFKAYHELSKSIDKNALEAFVQSSMGYGYFMLHLSDNQKTYQFVEITPEYMKKACQIKSKIDILYGGVTGGAKNVLVDFKTNDFKFEIDFRNRSGGIEPTVMGTKYTYLNWKGVSVD